MYTDMFLQESTKPNLTWRLTRWLCLLKRNRKLPSPRPGSLKLLFPLRPSLLQCWAPLQRRTLGIWHPSFDLLGHVLEVTKELPARWHGHLPPRFFFPQALPTIMFLKGRVYLFLVNFWVHILTCAYYYWKMGTSAMLLKGRMQRRAYGILKYAIKPVSNIL